jgi:hypothetical protein
MSDHPIAKPSKPRSTASGHSASTTFAPSLPSARPNWYHVRRSDGHLRNPVNSRGENVMRVQVSVADKIERFAARLGTAGQFARTPNSETP